MIDRFDLVEYEVLEEVRYFVLQVACLRSLLRCGTGHEGARLLLASVQVIKGVCGECNSVGYIVEFANQISYI